MVNKKRKQPVTAKSVKRQRSLANLKPFKKGQSGNPKGMKPGTVSITAAIKRELVKIPPELRSREERKTYLELLVKRILKKAIQDGNEAMIKSIWAYVDGQPKQPLEHAGNIDSTVTFKKQPEPNQIEAIIKALDQTGIFDKVKAEKNEQSQ
jgi:hypothetical protein